MAAPVDSRVGPEAEQPRSFHGEPVGAGGMYDLLRKGKKDMPYCQEALQQTLFYAQWPESVDGRAFRETAQCMIPKEMLPAPAGIR